MKVIVNGQEVDLNQMQGFQQRPRRSCLGTGCVVLGIALGVGGGIIGILAAVAAVAFPNVLTSVMGAITNQAVIETKPVPGDAAKFDPLGAYEGVKAFAGEGAILVSIEASQVKSDGTTDLTATYTPAPDVTYKFVIPVARPENAPPVGAGGTKDGQWYQPVTIRAFQPGQRRRVSRTSGGVRLSYDYVNEGMTKDKGDPTTNIGTFDQPFEGSPTCSYADFWEAALKKDAPKDAVARITFNSSGYEFRISGARISLEFDQNCKLRE